MTRNGKESKEENKEGPKLGPFELDEEKIFLRFFLFLQYQLTGINNYNSDGYILALYSEIYLNICYWRGKQVPRTNINLIIN